MATTLISIYISLLVLLLALSDRLTDASPQSSVAVGAYGEAGVITFDGTVSVGTTISASCTTEIQSEVAASIRNGYELFAEVVNTRPFQPGVRMGGKNYEFRATMIQDYCKQSRAESAIDILLGLQYSLFLGPAGNALSAVTLNKLNQTSNTNNNVMIVPAADQPELFLGPGVQSFGILPIPSAYEQTAFAFIESLIVNRSASTVSVVVLDDGTSKFCSNSTLYSLAAMSAGSIRLHGFYNTSNKDQLESALVNAKASAVDIIFGCTSTVELCVDTATTARTLDYSPAAMLFTDCLTYSSLYDELGNYARYLLGIYPWSPDDALSGHKSIYTNLTAVQFNSLYSSYFGSAPPSFHAASAFSAAELLVVAMEQTNNSSSIAIMGQLQNSFQVYQVLIGNISYATGRQPKLPLVVAQVDFLSSSKAIQNVVYRSQAIQIPQSVVVPLIYPAPTFVEQECILTKSNCSNQGYCDSSGKCQCNYGFFGASCEFICVGTFNSSAINTCVPDREFLVAQEIPADNSFAQEFKSVTKFIVDLINNSSESSITSGIVNVKIKLHATYGSCNANSGDSLFEDSMNWASTLSGELSGFIGARCSSTSKRFANRAIVPVIPQLSYSSTSESLGDKNSYPYFFRTVPSDKFQSSVLAKLFQDLNISVVSILYYDDVYCTGLYNGFVQSASSNTTVLYTKMFNDATTREGFEEILYDVLAAGAPAVLLISQWTPASIFFEVAKNVSAFQTRIENYLFFGVDAWVVYNSALVSITPPGTLGTRGSFKVTSQTKTFLDLWAAADPFIYIDSDEDRSSVDTRSLYLVDCVLALAHAMQLALNEFPFLDGIDFRHKIVDKLFDEVKFNGVSSQVSFDEHGDIDSQIFDAANLRHTGSYVVIGVVDKKDTSEVDYSKIQWPDSTFGFDNKTRYQNQMVPVCAPGYEPTLPILGNIMTCTPCRVGFYKYYLGTGQCLPCPEGTNCNDIGIILPCISPGYWQDSPVDLDAKGDFETYSVHICDLRDSCLGNCGHSSDVSRCALSSVPQSPTCAVCSSGYFRFFSACNRCTKDRAISSSALFAIFVLILIILTSGAIIFIRHRIRMIKISELKEFDRKAGARAIFRSLKLVLSFLQVLTGTSSIVDIQFSTTLVSLIEGIFYDPISSIASSFKCSGQYSDGDTELLKLRIGFFTPFIFLLLIFTVAVTTAHQESEEYFSVYASKCYNSIVSIGEISFGKHFDNTIPNEDSVLITDDRRVVVEEQDNPLHPHEHKSLDMVDVSSGQITLEIPSISSESELTLKPNAIDNIERQSLDKNVVLPDDKQQDKAESIEEKTNISSMKKSEKVFYNITNSFFYIVNWTFLFVYPFLSAVMITRFECRDLGITGNFMRRNYAISCSDDNYNSIFNYCVVGLIIYGSGIPIFLFYQIKGRSLPLWIQSSKILYCDYTKDWLYFEIYNSFRKLLLTSIAVYVAPRTSGQSLFLLFIGAVNFHIIYAYQPYEDINDNILAVTLASLEMFYFFIILVRKSGIASDAGLHVISMEFFLVSAVVITLAFLVPFTLAMKVPILQKYILKLMDDFIAIINYNLQPKLIFELNDVETEAFTSSLDREILSETDILAIEAYRTSSENRSSVSKLKNNTHQTTLILASLNVGIGLYNYPSVLSDAGVIGGILILITVLFMVRIALKHLAQVSEATGVMDLHLLCNSLFGKKGQIFLSFLLVFEGFLVLVVLITLAASTLSNVLSKWGCSSGVCSFYSIVTLLMVLVESRMCFRRYLAENFLIAAFATFSVVFSVMFIIIGGPLNNVDHQHEDTKLFSITGIIKNFGSVVFAAGFNFSAILQVYSAMRKRDAKNWVKVVFNTQIFTFFVFISVGLAAYLSFKDTTEKYVIDNFMNAAGEALSLILALQMALQIPQNFIVLRLNTTFLFSLPRQLPNIYHFGLSSLILVIAIAAAVIFTYTNGSSGRVFSSIINFLGCVTKSIISFIIPAILHMKIFGSKDKGYIENTLLILFGIFTLIIYPVGLSI